MRLVFLAICLAALLGILLIVSEPEPVQETDIERGLMP